MSGPSSFEGLSSDEAIAELRARLNGDTEMLREYEEQRLIVQTLNMLDKRAERLIDADDHDAFDLVGKAYHALKALVPCGEAYGANPDTCNEIRWHDGAHSNKYGTTWAS